MVVAAVGGFSVRRKAGEREREGVSRGLGFVEGSQAWLLEGLRQTD